MFGPFFRDLSAGEGTVRGRRRRAQRPLRQHGQYLRELEHFCRAIRDEEPDFVRMFTDLAARRPR